MNDLKSTIMRFLKYLLSDPKPKTPPASTAKESNEEQSSKPAPTFGSDAVVPVRKSPVGTRLLDHSNDQAIMTVQTAIRFWCWAAPALCMSTIIVTLPIGIFSGVQNSLDRYGQANVFLGANIFWGCFIALATSASLTYMAYTSTRPNVRVEVTKDMVKFGSYNFDRKFASGLRSGYSSGETELKTSIVQPKFGVAALRFGYGPWGEDLKYMVDAHYVDDICIWMNLIIDSVGAPEPKENDAQEGRKVELL